MNKSLNLMSVPAAFRKVAGYTPPDGTWRRWVLRRELVTWKVGGRIFTTTEAVEAFITHRSNASKPDLQPRVTEAEIRQLDQELGID